MGMNLTQFLLPALEGGSGTGATPQALGHVKEPVSGHSRVLSHYHGGEQRSSCARFVGDNSPQQMPYGTMRPPHLIGDS